MAANLVAAEMAIQGHTLAARQRGITMLEVLISIVVLGIGLLGLAGLQITGLSHNQDAYLRSQATFQAYDMADRMRANLGGVAEGHYGETMSPVEHNDCFTVAGCDLDDMAENDFFEWSERNARLLPGGSGVICRDSTPDSGNPADPECDNQGAVYAIKVWWLDGGRDGENRNEKRFVTSFQP